MKNDKTFYKNLVSTEDSIITVDERFPNVHMHKALSFFVRLLKKLFGVPEGKNTNRKDKKEGQISLFGKKYTYFR